MLILKYLTLFSTPVSYNEHKASRTCNCLTNISIQMLLLSHCSTIDPKLTKNVTPIPPPRKRKKITSRPLPPKPDDVIENHCPLKSLSKNAEPLYSSVKTSNLTTSSLHPKDSEINTKSENSNFDKVSEIEQEFIYIFN